MRTSVLTASETQRVFATFALGHQQAIDSTILPALRTCSEREVHFTRHPVGMLVLKLGRFNSSDLRMHVWRDGQSEPQHHELEIHSHPWALLSRVLAGAIQSEIFVAHPNPNGSRSVLDVSYESGTSSLHESGERVELSALGRTAWNRGEIYGLPPGCFHRASVDRKGLTVTLVAATASSSHLPAQVLAPMSSQQGHTFEESFERVEIGAHESAALLARIETHLSREL